MKKLLAWLLDRADEPSTWRGLFVVGSALGFLTLDAEKATLLAAGLAMLFGGVDVAVPEPTRKLLSRGPTDKLRGPDDSLQDDAEAFDDEAARRLESAASQGRRAFGLD
jgi:hypothetical protein